MSNLKNMLEAMKKPTKQVKLKMYITTHQADTIKESMGFDPRESDGYVVCDEMPKIKITKPFLCDDWRRTWPLIKDRIE